MNDLELYREELANCDAKITEALKERYAIIEKIMAYKEEYGLPILQPEQEEKQKKRLMFSLHNDKHRDEIYDVFERIQRNSKKIQARKLFDYNIVLIGFMGAGKSTISDYLSTMFAMEVVEMDQLIAEREGMSISDIFETYGEEYFRNMETNLLIEMQSHKNAVISCGGGAALRERNVAEMRSFWKWMRIMFKTFYPDEYVASTYVLDFEKMYREGCRGLVFDIDNTLVPHGAPADERAICLFDRLRSIGFDTCLISNNQEPRVKPFAEKVQSKYVFNAHKPSTKNYIKAMELMQTDRGNTVFIGDQLFTDVWGAKRTGMKSILVKPIYPKEEIQIVLKRYLEKIVLHFYKKENEKRMSCK